MRACTCTAALCYVPIAVNWGRALSGGGVQMFTRKFERLAASYSDAVFCEILGDENNDTRVRRTLSRSCMSGCLCGSMAAKRGLSKLGRVQHGPRARTPSLWCGCGRPGSAKAAHSLAPLRG